MVAPKVARRSIHERGRSAAAIPAPSPTTTEISTAASVSDKVAGIRSSTASETRTELKNDVPRSPCTALPSHVR